MEKAGQPGVLRAALLGLCPRCGQGRMFQRYIALEPVCSHCGLDYSGFIAGDGPAAMVVLVAGFFVAGAALMVEVTYSPPYWVHAVLWLPTILIVTLSLLRIVKAVFIVLQYRHNAGADGMEI